MHCVTHFAVEKMPGLETLRKEVKDGAHDHLLLSDLCKLGETEGRYLFPVFGEAEILTPMLKEFEILATAYKNDIFDKAWSIEVRKKGTADLTFEVVMNHIWSPVYEQCKSLLSTIRDKTIQLSEINAHFGHLEEALLEKQVICLNNGFQRCSDKQEGESSWVKSFIDGVHAYKQIKSYHSAAAVFCHLKEKFELTGDFDGAHKLLDVVCFNV